MLGNNFFVPGRKYRVITPRVDSTSSKHFFEVGTVVTCQTVTVKGRMVSHSKHVDRDIQRTMLAGLFVDEKGVDQQLYVGDVKLWQP